MAQTKFANRTALPSSVKLKEVARKKGEKNVEEVLKLVAGAPTSVKDAIRDTYLESFASLMQYPDLRRIADATAKFDALSQLSSRDASSDVNSVIKNANKEMEDFGVKKPLPAKLGSLVFIPRTNSLSVVVHANDNGSLLTTQDANGNSLLPTSDVIAVGSKINAGEKIRAYSLGEKVPGMVHAVIFGEKIKADKATIRKVVALETEIKEEEIDPELKEVEVDETVLPEMGECVVVVCEAEKLKKKAEEEHQNVVLSPGELFDKENSILFAEFDKATKKQLDKFEQIKREAWKKRREGVQRGEKESPERTSEYLQTIDRAWAEYEKETKPELEKYRLKKEELRKNIMGSLLRKKAEGDTPGPNAEPTKIEFEDKIFEKEEEGQAPQWIADRHNKGWHVWRMGNPEVKLMLVAAPAGAEIEEIVKQSGHKPYQDALEAKEVERIEKEAGMFDMEKHKEKLKMMKKEPEGIPGAPEDRVTITIMYKGKLHVCIVDKNGICGFVPEEGKGVLYFDENKIADGRVEVTDKEGVPVGVATVTQGRKKASENGPTDEQCNELAESLYGCKFNECSGAEQDEIHKKLGYNPNEGLPANASVSVQAPFKSRDQEKWMWANHPEMAKEWESHMTPEVRKELPERVSKHSSVQEIPLPDLKELVTLFNSILRYNGSEQARNIIVEEKIKLETELNRRAKTEQTVKPGTEPTKPAAETTSPSPTTIPKAPVANPPAAQPQISPTIMPGASQGKLLKLIGEVVSVEKMPAGASWKAILKTKNGVVASIVSKKRAYELLKKVKVQGAPKTEPVPGGLAETKTVTPQKLEQFKQRPKEIPQEDAFGAPHANALLQKAYDSYMSVQSEIASIQEMIAEASEKIKTDNALVAKQAEAQSLLNKLTQYVHTIEMTKVGDRILALIESEDLIPVYTEKVQSNLKEMAKEAAEAKESYLVKVRPQMEKIKVVTQRLVDFPAPTAPKASEKGGVTKVGMTAEEFVDNLKNLVRSMKEFVTSTMKLSKTVDETSVEMAEGEQDLALAASIEKKATELKLGPEVFPSKAALKAFYPKSVEGDDKKIRMTYDDYTVVYAPSQTGEQYIRVMS